MSLAIANQYAKALLEVVTKPGSELSPEAAMEQLETVSAAIKASADLREVMMTPAIPRNLKAKALDRVGQVLGLAPVIGSFLVVVTSRRRAGMFSDICDAFRSRLDERMGVVRAHVRAAPPLTGAQQEALSDSLHKLTGKRVFCDYAEDPSLVGGLTVRIGSTIYDGSVQGQLEALRRRLVSES